LAYDKYQAGLDKHGLRNWLFSDRISKGGWRWIVLPLLFPLFLYGAINNALPWFLPARFAERKVKDLQFRSSIVAAGGLFVFIIFWAIQVLLVTLIADSSFIGLIYLFTLPGTGIIARWWNRQFKKLRGVQRYRRLQKNDAAAFESLQSTCLFLREKVKNLNFLKTI